MESTKFAQKIEGRHQQRQNELALWHQWKGGDQAALGPLFQSLTPLMRRASFKFRGNLPESYVDAMVKKHTLEALHTYDPSRAQLNTHIMHRLNKVKRDISQYQNPGRLSEASHWRVPTFQNVQVNLQESLGREPTAEELGSAMGVRTDEIQRLQAGTRRDLASVEGQLMWKTPEQDQMKMILEDIGHELSPLEQNVLHMTFGVGGLSPMEAKDIARKTGLSPGRISQLRHGIGEKIQRYYGSRNVQSQPPSY